MNGESSEFVGNEGQRQIMISSSSSVTAIKKCTICGANSSYCNLYGVRSCEGCKQFFRRAVIKQKFYNCWNQGNCELEKGFRCRGCRLNKALLVGMDPRRVSPKEACPQFVEKLEQRRETLLHQKFMSELVGSRECEGESQLSILLHLEDGFRKIYDSSKPLPPAYVYRHEKVDDLMADSQNLLATAQLYHKGPIEFWDEAKSLWHVETHGIFSEEIMRAPIKDWLLCIEFGKALPFFRKLELNDQIHLLQNCIGPVNYLCGAYYSHKMGAKTFIRKDGYKTIAHFWAKCFKDDKKLLSMAAYLYCDTVERLAQVDVDHREFVLMMAIMFANSAVDNLSAPGRELLYAESCRYTKALQTLTNEKYGPSGGAQKLANLIALINFYFNAKNQALNLATYLEIFYAKQDPRFKFPQALISCIPRNC